MILAVLLSTFAIGANARCCGAYWTGCKACPAAWYTTCPGGDGDQRGCGFLGCQIECRCPKQDYGCGCNNSKACLKKDCKVGAFGAWGACSKPCAGGKQTRTRAVTQNAAYGGAACPPLSQEQACNTQPCRKDCAVSAFGAWSDCDKECGGGEQTRTRTITQKPVSGGNACPALFETKPCNTQVCLKPSEACKTFAWYEELCKTRFNAKECKNAGCSFKKDVCVPKPRGKKIKCKKALKIKIEDLTICECFTGCTLSERANKKGRKKKVCAGTHSFPKEQ